MAALRRYQALHPSDANPLDSMGDINLASGRLPEAGNFVQVVGAYDAANGTVRQKMLDYAAGRNDPTGPLGSKEYLVSMDRYAGFVYHDLIVKLMAKSQPEQPVAAGQ